MEPFINVISIINIKLMDIALLLVVNRKFDIIIDRTLGNYILSYFIYSDI